MPKHNYLPDVAKAMIHRKTIPITAREIAEKLEINIMTVQRHIMHLEIMGYVERQKISKMLRDSRIFKRHNRGNKAKNGFTWIGAKLDIDWKTVSWKIQADVPELKPTQE